MTMLQIKAITSSQSPPAVIDDTPRIYALQKYVFYISVSIKLKSRFEAKLTITDYY